jgi:hypothetical protein
MDSEYNADGVDDGASVNDNATREGEEELSTAMADGLVYDWDCAIRLWTRSMLTWRILQSMMCVPMKQAKKHSTCGIVKARGNEDDVEDDDDELVDETEEFEEEENGEDTDDEEDISPLLRMLKIYRIA